MDSVDDKYFIIIGIIGILIFLAIIFESSIFLYSYMNADKVECNLLWCSFTTEKTNINERIISNQTIVSNSQCFKNGIEINCSDIPKHKMTYYGAGMWN